MSTPTRHLLLYRACGIAVICLVVFGVSFPLLERIIN